MDDSWGVLAPWPSLPEDDAVVDGVQCLTIQTDLTRLRRSHRSPVNWERPQTRCMSATYQGDAGSASTDHPWLLQRPQCRRVSGKRVTGSHGSTQQRAVGC